TRESFPQHMQFKKIKSPHGTFSALNFTKIFAYTEKRAKGKTSREQASFDDRPSITTLDTSLFRAAFHA
ncbi:MAG TPA: hypothetical protein VFV38_25110, partial [Ktedonobacteraceae bacterium]|nr:hypothetical protein [Ktedonobacteraceae bacterium]